MAVSTVRGTMEVNFFGVIQTTVILLPLVRKSTNGGVIVNVSSTLGSNTMQAEQVRNTPIGSGGSSRRDPTAYSSSKAALNSYTIALAHELKGEGIKVNAVSPGLTSTKLTSHLGKTPKAGAEVLVPWVLLEKDGPTGTCLEWAVNILGGWHSNSTGRFINYDNAEVPWWILGVSIYISPRNNVLRCYLTSWT